MHRHKPQTPKPLYQIRLNPPHESLKRAYIQNLIPKKKPHTQQKKPHTQKKSHTQKKGPTSKTSKKKLFFTSAESAEMTLARALTHSIVREHIL